MVPTLVATGLRFSVPTQESKLTLPRSMIALLMGLNVLDAYFTWMWISQGMATEANPLMASALEWGAGWFVFIKLFLVSGGCYILWRRAGENAPRYVFPLFALYAGIVLYHLSKTASVV